jgi:RNA:NAD 2'-phosphotransferase (TPT1/KptA family)
MKWYHGTSEDVWQIIQQEGVLFGRRFVEGREVSRCTYLTNVLNEARCNGDVVLEVEYNPLNEDGTIRTDEIGALNNYSPNEWQMRVYEPIPIENVKRIE